MSAIAAPVAPPAAVSSDAGRLKRKAKLPERYQSPPPAKRARVVAVKAKKPGNGDKLVASAAPVPGRSGKHANPGWPAASRIHGYHQVCSADTGVSAVALAALSSPSAAALLGQSPVPHSVANRAIEEAAEMLSAPDNSGGLAGLALLLAASTGSPFRADFEMAGGFKQPKTTKARVERGAENIKGWGEGSRRKRSVAPGGGVEFKTENAPGAATGSFPEADVSGKDARRPGVSAKHGHEGTVSNPAFQNGTPSQSALTAAGSRLAETAAPGVVLKHCFRWMDLVVADLKGRAAALRRSRRRLQKVKQETERAVAQSGVTVICEERGLLKDLDKALAAESRGVDASLRAATELRAVAIGEKAFKALPLPSPNNKEEDGDGDGTPGGVGKMTGRGRGRPKGPACGDGIGVGALVGDRFAGVGAMLRGDFGEATRTVRSFLSPQDAAASRFDQTRTAMAEAFIKTGLDAASAEKRGDYEKAGALACPAAAVPVAHVPTFASEDVSV